MSLRFRRLGLLPLAITTVLATAFIAYGTFRHGLWAVLTGSGWELRALFTCLIALVCLWRAWHTGSDHAA